MSVMIATKYRRRGGLESKNSAPSNHPKTRNPDLQQTNQKRIPKSFLLSFIFITIIHPTTIEYSAKL
jgi:hypothetical protein